MLGILVHMVATKPASAQQHRARQAQSETATDLNPEKKLGKRKHHAPESTGLVLIPAASKDTRRKEDGHRRRRRRKEEDQTPPYAQPMKAARLRRTWRSVSLSGASPVHRMPCQRYAGRANKHALSTATVTGQMCDSGRCCQNTTKPALALRWRMGARGIRMPHRATVIGDVRRQLLEQRVPQVHCGGLVGAPL